MTSLGAIQNKIGQITEDDLGKKIDAIQKEQQMQRWMIIALALIILLKK
jgi:hypothetical protein